jgi:hypothetical protein
VARAVLRRVRQLGDGAEPLTRALAVLGAPAPLRQAAELAGQDLQAAARLADGLRAIDVLAPGSMLEFAHPVVRSAVYQAIPPGERALAHARAARLLQNHRPIRGLGSTSLARFTTQAEHLATASIRWSACLVAASGIGDTHAR